MWARTSVNTVTYFFITQRAASIIRTLVIEIITIRRRVSFRAPGKWKNVLIVQNWWKLNKIRKYILEFTPEKSPINVVLTVRRTLHKVQIELRTNSGFTWSFKMVIIRCRLVLNIFWRVKAMSSGKTYSTNRGWLMILGLLMLGHRSVNRFSKILIKKWKWKRM